ncbi:MAG: PP2C family protein-serine/threonine phosphatase [Candidatus Competibacteraceae bacterium]
MRCEPAKPLRWNRGAASQLGGRHEQQDRWSIFLPPDEQGLLTVVADGMGGHLDGALGAQLVIDTARTYLQNSVASLRADPPAALRQLCQAMHETINDRSESARSTVVLVWIDQDRAYWLNVGDSRLYHFRRGRRLMRTRDHSAVQLLMDMGEIDESEMATHPAQNRLYRCLGGEDAPKPDTGEIVIQPGDLLALCSDGVWEHVTEPEFWTAALTTGPITAAQKLAEQAVQRGGASADNATLVLLQADTANAGGSSGWKERLASGFAALFNR